MIKKTIPLLPLRDIVVFPGMVAPLFVGRKLSVNALNHAMTDDKKIFLVTQKDSEVENPNIDNLYQCGIIAKVLQLLKLPDGTIKVLVEGLQRANIKNLYNNKDFTSVSIKIVNKKSFSNSKLKALTKIVIEQFEEYIKVNKKLPSDLLNNLKSSTDPVKISDLISVNLGISLEQNQELLELYDIEKRLDKIYSYLLSEIDSFQVEKKIKGRVKRQMEKTQKEYYLNEQMKAIQKE
jgi:ATP-dependent Lon protease